MNWKYASVSLALSYVYLYIRVQHQFGESPNTLKIGLISTIMAYSINAYLISKTMKKSFLATYEAKESSEDFKKFLHNLPEGISIIDDSTSDFKFFNEKLKNTFDIKTFVKNQGDILKLEQLNNRVNQEYDQLDDKLAQEFEYCEDTQKLMKDLMMNFSVKDKTQESERRANIFENEVNEENKEIGL